MTFRDLLEKGEGTIYLVNIKKPFKVEVYDSLIMTKGEFYNRYQNHLGYYREPNDPQNVRILRKSHDKRCNTINGYPRPVEFSSVCANLTVLPTELDKSVHKSWKVIAFTNKDDACDYVIDKIKRQKLEFNAMLIKANKLKFGNDTEDGLQ